MLFTKVGKHALMGPGLDPVKGQEGFRQRVEHVVGELVNRVPLAAFFGRPLSPLLDGLIVCYRHREHGADLVGINLREGRVRAFLGTGRKGVGLCPFSTHAPPRGSQGRLSPSSPPRCCGGGRDAAL